LDQLGVGEGLWVRFRHWGGRMSGIGWLDKARGPAVGGIWQGCGVWRGRGVDYRT
jgi:hypothetical protein